MWLPGLSSPSSPAPHCGGEMKAQDARPLGGGPQPSLHGCPGLRFPGRQVSHQAGPTSGMLVTGASGPVCLLQDGGCHSLPRYTSSLRLWIRGDSPVSLHGYLSALTPGRSSMVPLSPEPCASITCSLLLPPLPLQQASKSGDTFGGSKGPTIKRCNLVWVLCFDFAQLRLCAFRLILLAGGSRATCCLSRVLV